MFRIYRCPACKETIDTTLLNASLQRHGVFNSSFTCPMCSVRLRLTAPIYLLFLLTLVIGGVHLFTDIDALIYSLAPMIVMMILFRMGQGFKQIE
ncbi:hypothetical protein DU002_05780 [Corallincola holothuriorum]|uniref:Cxxc_20_cxxc protein n=1 Tax=Corallincola holothuriorum TaxID=2282215 RepID=A0A368NKZ7_9GAMM|nr:hypothetical protein [Corallincola holothuriorum]RCU50836.1 hypothetical protein DU002_05780 [Corallincola holothuriorum]